MEEGSQPRRMGQRGWAKSAWLAGVAGLAWGCGPTQSTALIMDADVLLQAATTADAEKLAPFEWTGAREYLHKAREEQGYSDYETAIDFADKAKKLAGEAKSKAMAAKADGALPSSPTAASKPSSPDPKAEPLDPP